MDDKQIKIIMGLVTIFVPFAVIPYSVYNGQMTVSIHALVWGIMPEGYTYLSLFYVYYILLGRGLVFGIFNIWYCIAVIRYTQNHGSRLSVIISGVLTILYPLFWVYGSLPFLANAESLVYAGPIPIQLLIGLILIRFVRKPEITTAWSE